MSQTRLSTLCACLLVLATTAATAQTLTGSIAGVVKDDQGAVLPGVTVTLTGARGGIDSWRSNRAPTTSPPLSPGSSPASRPAS